MRNRHKKQLDRMDFLSNPSKLEKIYNWVKNKVIHIFYGVILNESAFSFWLFPDLVGDVTTTCESSRRAILFIYIITYPT